MKPRNSSPASSSVVIATYVVLLAGAMLTDRYLLRSSSTASFIVQHFVLMVALPAGVLLGLRRYLPGSIWIDRVPVRALGWSAIASALFIAFYYYFAFVLSNHFPAIDRAINGDAFMMRMMRRQMPPVAIIASIAYVAFAEEFFFRGFMIPALYRRAGLIVACLVCAALFSILHLIVGKLLVVFVAGFWFSYVTIRAGSLWAGVIAHGLLNGTAFMLLVIGDRISSDTFVAVRRPSEIWLAVFVPALIAAIALVEWKVRPAPAEVPPAAPDGDSVG